MRHRLYHVILLASVLSANVRAQNWFWKNPLPQGNDIRALCAAGSILYAVGDFGTVIKSTNGGSNWFHLQTPTTANLHGVSFSDANNGAAVGDAGLILTTSDGGISWSTKSLGDNNTLRCLLCHK